MAREKESLEMYLTEEQIEYIKSLPEEERQAETEKLLGIKVKTITYPAAEKSIDVSATQKSIRLDLYVETDEGIILDIEIQTADGSEGWLAKRTRYYQSMIDLDVLGKGMDYTDLKQSYVIFICTFDPFPDNGRKLYTFNNRCHEQDGVELGDETTKMFLNAKGTIGKVDKDIDSFLAYVDGKAAEGKFTQDVASEVDKVKQHNETKVEYMTLMMELKQQRREGQEEERVHSIRKMMQKLNLTAKQAMDILDIPVNEQEKYVNSLCTTP